MVVLLFLFRSFIPVLSLYKAAKRIKASSFMGVSFANRWTSRESKAKKEHLRLCLVLKWRLIKSRGRVRLASSQLCLVQPFGQDGLQFAGVFKAQLKIFKAADGGLAELGAVHCSESLSYVSLSVACQQNRNTWQQKNFGWFLLSFWLIAAMLTQFDSPYLEVIRKHLQFSYLRGVHGRGIFWIPGVFPLGVGFHLPNARAPGGLISR